MNLLMAVLMVNIDINVVRCQQKKKDAGFAFQIWIEIFAYSL